ncbi:cytochrome b [Shewanella dokdonensis]|uniref:Cytochrome b n=1 Tax=Shewanella dokdonensis TaxID=712036 RepID=A0ABX8DGK5_9GAMM|nr:cytochrome b [Shewanella dokdonensis]MCL1074113.1 cytochrome b [Shewanella dokdonensis]QVK23853.1 cytochrome b [Shewanella dokdonensis]
MATQNRSYTGTAKVLHWAMAIVILTAMAIGAYSGLFLSYGIDAAHDLQKSETITLHKSIATISLFLIVLRIIWRVTHRPPALTGMSQLMIKAAHAGHHLLYLLMVLVPVVGWAYSSAAGYPIPVAGLFTIPPLLPKSPDLVPYIAPVHSVLAYTLLVVIAGHAAFALKHYFIDKDDTLQSMLPGHKK